MTAASLRSLHRPGDPLLLPNAWDVASARCVRDAGFAAVATSSGAVAATHGFQDHHDMPADVAFDATARICAAVKDVPVTADLEGGYGLDPEELVERTLAAGAAGLNLEDTDHAVNRMHPVEDQVRWLRAVRHAAGDHLVINARIDSLLHGSTDIAEIVDRAVRYTDAGADCVFPIGLSDPSVIQDLVAAVPAVNVLIWRDAPPPFRLAELGVARISWGEGVHRASMKTLRAHLDGLATSAVDASETGG